MSTSFEQWIYQYCSTHNCDAPTLRVCWLHKRSRRGGERSVGEGRWGGGGVGVAGGQNDGEVQRWVNPLTTALKSGSAVFSCILTDHTQVIKGWWLCLPAWSKIRWAWELTTQQGSSPEPLPPHKLSPFNYDTENGKLNVCFLLS